ncbi:hypothetical protein J4467_01015 [Candidatus Woesearchaeota archaeon]|nr:hypothetical protein [Candidatus Woesearchaeota archaeon]
MDVLIDKYFFENHQPSPLETLYERLRGHDGFLSYEIKGTEGIEGIVARERIQKTTLSLIRIIRDHEGNEITRENNYNSAQEFLDSLEERLIIQGEKLNLEIVINPKHKYDINNIIENGNKEPWKNGTDLILNQVIEKLYPIIHTEQQRNLKAKKK